jgi:hypothetical protein
MMRGRHQASDLLTLATTWEVVASTGLEPMAFRIQDRRSNHVGSWGLILTCKSVKRGQRYHEDPSGRVIKNRSARIGLSPSTDLTLNTDPRKGTIEWE